MGDFRLQSGTLPARGPRKSDPTRDEPGPSSSSSVPSSSEPSNRRQGAEALRSINQPAVSRRGDRGTTAADEGGWRTVPRSGPSQQQGQPNGRDREREPNARREGRDGREGSNRQSDRPGMRDIQRGSTRGAGGERMAVDRNGERRRWNDDVPGSEEGPRGSGSTPAWMDDAPSSGPPSSMPSSAIAEGGHVDQLQAFKAQMREMERRQRLAEGGVAVEESKPAPSAEPASSSAPPPSEPSHRVNGHAAPQQPGPSLVDPAITNQSRAPQIDIPQPSLVMPDGMSIDRLVEPNADSKPRAGSRFAKFFGPGGAQPSNAGPAAPPPPQSFFDGPRQPQPPSYPQQAQHVAPPANASDMESMRRVMNMLQFSVRRQSQRSHADPSQRPPGEMASGPPPPRPAADGMFGRGPPPSSNDFDHQQPHRVRPSNDYNAAALANLLSGAQAAMNGQARFASQPAPSSSSVYAGSIASASAPSGPQQPPQLGRGYGAPGFGYGQQPSAQSYGRGPSQPPQLGLFGQPMPPPPGGPFYGQQPQQPPPGFGPGPPPNQGRGGQQQQFGGYASPPQQPGPNADLLALMAGGMRSRGYDEPPRR